MKAIQQTLLAAGLLAASAASAALNIDTVFVGDAGNAGDVQVQGTFGAVSYAYHIGTHEVTNAQYTNFLNSVAATDPHNLYNVANYLRGADWNNQNGNVTTVGSAEAPSHYGTFDQGGNVKEWIDTIPSGVGGRVLWGGAFALGGAVEIQSSGRSGTSPTFEDEEKGFRVSSLAAIPEPSTYAAILGCLGLSLALMRRKGNV